MSPIKKKLIEHYTFDQAVRVTLTVRFCQNNTRVHARACARERVSYNYLSRKKPFLPKNTVDYRKPYPNCWDFIKKSSF